MAKLSISAAFRQGVFKNVLGGQFLADPIGGCTQLPLVPHLEMTTARLHNLDSKSGPAKTSGDYGSCRGRGRAPDGYRGQGS